MTTEPCPHCGTPRPSDTTEPCPGCILQLGLRNSVPPLSADQADAADGLARDEIARAFPELQIGRVLGRGGMGVVYETHDLKLDRRIALKLLPPAAGADPGFASRFLREARAMARLDHPNIVRIFGFGEVRGLYYITMEYVDGQTLRDYMGRPDFTPAQALALVPGICDALEFAHKAGVVHRDIKPENILITRDGTPKVADFGLARRSSEETRLTHGEQVLGTLHYMAPEQLRAAATADHRADIYSLGVVLYELLTGELPIGRFAPPSSRTGVDPRLDPVVLRSLESEPDRRYQRAAELGADVSQVGSSAAMAQQQAPWTGLSTRVRALSPPERGLLACFVLFVVASCLPWFTNVAAAYPSTTEILPDGSTVTTQYGRPGRIDGSAWGTETRPVDGLHVPNHATVFVLLAGVVALLWPGAVAARTRRRWWLVANGYGMLHVGVLLLECGLRANYEVRFGAVVALLVLLGGTVIAAWPVREPGPALRDSAVPR